MELLETLAVNPMALPCALLKARHKPRFAMFLVEAGRRCHGRWCMARRSV